LPPSFGRKEKRGHRKEKRGHRTKRHPPIRRSLLASATNLAELDPKLDSLRIVDAEHGHGGSADGGSPAKDESHPFKMTLPAGAI
jgi:hypothetical protein